MAKAKNISRGDWISVGGRPVKVTHVDDYSPSAPKGKSMRISYKHKSRSGVLARNGGDDVSRIGSSWGWKW